MMKKMISVLLMIAVFCGVFTAAASANDTSGEDDSHYHFEERYFGEDYHSTEYNPDTKYDPDFAFYDELYYHYDENGDIDWALIRANKEWGEASCASAHYGKYFFSGDFYYGFTMGIGLYDVKQDRFWDICNDTYWRPYSRFKPGDYDGFYEGLDALMNLPRARTGLEFLLAGDMDANGTVNILDATYIQRWLAGFTYREYGGQVAFGTCYGPEDLADYDCDGKATILDATRIQRNLAGLG